MDKNVTKIFWNSSSEMNPYTKKETSYKIIKIPTNCVQVVMKTKNNYTQTSYNSLENMVSNAVNSSNNIK